MPKIAVETPPFNNWKFNISIRTDNPFLIQSNLARGRITINLQAGGTGAAPSLTGFVQSRSACGIAAFQQDGDR